ncbi:hypothetical protein C0989_006351 [Termitomyces sp. Mn162]|nr:hypothetical protein C0989_006351 [Termitomyces sp. Mn162]
MPMLRELMGWDFQHRRILQQEFNYNAATHFHPYQLNAARGLLRNLLDSPDDLFDNLRHMAGETIMALTYGLKIKPKNDPWVAMAAQSVLPLFKAAVPGAFLVDSIPILKHVPDWMPFAGFKRKAKHWRKQALNMINMPYEAAKRNIVNSVIHDIVYFANQQ